jgi:hypothetical protein
VSLGSNDVGRPDLFEDSMREIVDYSINQGVIPILGTKADGNANENTNNDIIRAIALEFELPLWDFEFLAQTLDSGGFESDGVHLTSFYTHDYTQPDAFQRGYGLLNLSALIALDTVWRETLYVR